MTTERAQRGYRLTQFLSRFQDERHRQAMTADPLACMQAAGLSEAEKDMVARRDFVAMLDHGAATVAVAKICRYWGISLVEMGAAGRGQSVEQFMTERRRANKGQPWEF